MTDDLWEVGGGTEIQCPKIIIDLVAIVPARNEDARIVENGDMVSASGRWLPARDLGLPLQCD